MQFFSAIQPLLEGGMLRLEITKSGNDIRVVASQAGEGPLAIPLPLVAPASELDAQWVDYLLNFSRARKSLQDQFDSTSAILNAAQAESAKKATQAIASLNDAPKSELGDEDDEGGTPVRLVEKAPQLADGLVDNLFEV